MKFKISRGVIYLVLVITLGITLNYSRIKIGFLRLPKGISDTITGPSRVVYIYGNPCTVCGSGRFLLSFADEKAATMNIFVLSTDYTGVDIDNLKAQFNLEGAFIVSDELLEESKINAKKYSIAVEKSSGYCLDIRKDRTVKKVVVF